MSTVVCVLQFLFYFFSLLPFFLLASRTDVSISFFLVSLFYITFNAIQFFFFIHCFF
ncbi:hypothetical protein Tsubulata_001924 [Turnera subulata]|uniref:Uncharacterized protein n=1 Tax=Turnera subulata TaxID=218843 RepID=A0A9Q0FJY8_9ROSI|nr:hypothetical protein Tsubulata_001924 [Turnera subulata]